MSERTALLDKPTTPLPKAQLFLLFFIRMTDPVAFNCIFPFVQQMLLDIGAVEDPEKVGYYAGIVSHHTVHDDRAVCASVFIVFGADWVCVGGINVLLGPALYDLSLGSLI